MAEEEMVQTQTPLDMHNVDQMWERLGEGLKARAMRDIHEEQQKLVVDLQRQAMELGVEIASCVVRAKAAQEMAQEDVKIRIIEQELIPKQQELQVLDKRVETERALLETYSKIGRGII